MNQSGTEMRLTPGAELLALPNFMKVQEYVLHDGVHKGELFPPTQIRQLDDYAINWGLGLRRPLATTEDLRLSALPESVLLLWISRIRILPLHTQPNMLTRSLLKTLLFIGDLQT